MEASEVLGTEDLVTNTRDPEFSLDSTISTQTSSEELVGAQERQDRGMRQWPVTQPMLVR